MSSITSFPRCGRPLPLFHPLQQPGYGPQAARRRRAGELRSPRRLRRRACGPPAAPKTLPPPGAAVFGLFLWEGVRFLRLMFFRRPCTFCGRDRTDSPSPERKAIGSFLSTLAVCRFWAFAVGKNSPHPRKGKPMGRFYPPSPPVDFGLLRWGRIVPIPARKSDWVIFIHPRRLSILGFCGGEG